MSISKYRETNRRKLKEEQKIQEEMEDLRRRNNEPKKLSLSFNKSKRNNEMEMRHTEERR